jgi:hypothetical protein
MAKERNPAYDYLPDDDDYELDEVDQIQAQEEYDLEDEYWKDDDD